MKNAWTFQDAKRNLGQLVSGAQTEGPQIIVREGKEIAVVISVQLYQKLIRRRGNLYDYFQNSPMRGADLDFSRIDEYSREMES